MTQRFGHVSPLGSLPGQCPLRRYAVLAATGCLALALASCSAAIAAERPPQRWALLIGVNDYTSLKSLKFARADQKDLAATLIKTGFPEDQVILLEDEARDKKLIPIRANIEQQLRLLLDPEHGLAKRGDLVIVGFSGHGVSLAGKSWLCPAEARLDDPEGTMIPLERVYGRLKDSRAALKLVLVDACRDDPEIDGRRSARSAQAASEFAASLRRPPTGLLLLTSCGERQFAMEEPEFGHGVFMHFVLEGLRGKAADDEGQITLAGLYNYASGKTEKYVARRFGAFQTPALEGKIDGNFELARLERAMPQSPDPPAKPAAPAPGETITNTIGMKLTLIPAGEFRMGSDEDPDALLKEANNPAFKREWFAAEHPAHRVRITRNFYLGTYEVTLAQFRRFAEANDYRSDAEKDGKGGWGWTGKKGEEFKQSPEFTWRKWGVNQSDESPVVNVSWNDAVAFCEWLSKQEGKTYRLPTEAEWEYACRAGTSSRYYSGNDPEGLAQVGNVADGTAKEMFPWWKNVIQAKDGYAFTAPAGKFRPNAFGLYDMHGNAWEWCSDRYANDYYAQSPVDDPQGPSAGSSRVIRGGGWRSGPVYCRSAFRDGFEPAFRFCGDGFRVVCER